MPANNEVSTNALKQGLACCIRLKGLSFRKCPYVNKPNCIDTLMLDCLNFIHNKENNS